jgi:hypothetical protein
MFKPIILAAGYRRGFLRRGWEVCGGVWIAVRGINQYLNEKTAHKSGGKRSETITKKRLLKVFAIITTDRTCNIKVAAAAMALNNKRRLQLSPGVAATRAMVSNNPNWMAAATIEASGG